MSLFAIFAIVLTIGYIIYYGVTISRDLYGKKGQDNETEEIFEMGNMPEIEEATLVTETEDSFFVGTLAEQEKSSDTIFSKADSSNLMEKEEKCCNLSDSGNNVPQKENQVERHIESIRQNMLEGDIQSEIVMNEQQLEDYLISEQMIIFDNERANRGLQKVEYSEEMSQEMSSTDSSEVSSRAPSKVPAEISSRLSMKGANSVSGDGEKSGSDDEQLGFDDEKSGYRGKSEISESGIRDAI